MKTIFTNLLIIIVSAATMTSCNKDAGDKAAGGSRDTKFEITGNYSGKLTIVINDNVNGNTVLTDISVPWSKEIIYSDNVTGIGIGAQGSVAGTPGQTITMKIYTGGVERKSSSGTVDANGVLSLPTLAYLF